jgi:site-specific recombinase XerD
MALILTYTLGLRVHETLSITLNDVDMDNCVITIQQSKFYKSRLVPFNHQVKEVLDAFLQWRKEHQQSSSPEAHLFINQHGKPLNAASLRGIFHRIKDKAGIKRNDGCVFKPRLHDLRHTFAVTCLISWYRQGKDVQQLLPILSVYMGHEHLAYTSVYLTMTNDLLHEANVRFERYITNNQS